MKFAWIFLVVSYLGLSCLIGYEYSKYLKIREGKYIVQGVDEIACEKQLRRVNVLDRLADKVFFTGLALAVVALLPRYNEDEDPDLGNGK